MHYANGREAKAGDPVIGETYEVSGQIIAGTIHSLQAGNDQCNCTVAEPVPGGVNQRSCMTVGKLFHAEDAFKTLKVAAVAVLLLAVLGFTGCTFTRETTSINTPAVYAVTKDASGAQQTNLVSAASVKTTTARERIWLPEGYSVTHNTVMYGVEVSMTDSTTQTPKVRAGIVDDSWRWIPSATNKLHSPPITVSAELNNKGIPFSLSGKGRFTSGETQVSATETNATATAIVPGTPSDQTK